MTTGDVVSGRGVRAPDDLDADGTLEALREAQRLKESAEALHLVHAAHWVDLHAPEPQESDDPLRRPVERSGGDGTPMVEAWAVHEAAVVLGMTRHTARRLLADAVNLRHRFPRWWHLVVHGQAAAWKVRQLLTVPGLAELTREQAHWVDAQTAEAVPGLPLTRLLHVVTAKVIAADEAAAAARAESARRRRYVALGRSTDDGARHLIAHLDAADATRLQALVRHVADRLALTAPQGTPREALEAEALGRCAHPAALCLFLADTREDAAADAGMLPEASAAELATALGQALRDLSRAEGGAAALLDRLRPTSTLYVHLAAEALDDAPATGVARVECGAESLGPVTIGQVRDWLQHDRVRLTPVIDLRDEVSADCYEVPRRLREHLRARTPYEVFPYGVTPTGRAQLDHTVAYQPGAGPTQTRTGNLGPLGARHHRLKTFAPGWQHHQPQPGTWFWATPHGHWFRVDHRGTTPFGRSRPRHRDPALSRGEARLALALDVQ